LIEPAAGLDNWPAWEGGDVIELPRVKPGKSDASYLVKPIKAGDIDGSAAATGHSMEKEHLRGDGNKGRGNGRLFVRSVTL
jgi:hypothetical protein